MKVELYALCQGAFNTNGQLTIVNTIDTFVVPNFPVRVSFGLALKLYIYPEEEGEKTLTISILDKENKSIIPPIPTSLHIERLDKASHIAIAINLQNVLFEKSGAYEVHLELDGERWGNYAFEIEQR